MPEKSGHVHLSCGTIMCKNTFIKYLKKMSDDFPYWNPMPIGETNSNHKEAAPGDYADDELQGKYAEAIALDYAEKARRSRLANSLQKNSNPLEVERGGGNELVKTIQLRIEIEVVIKVVQK